MRRKLAYDPEEVIVDLCHNIEVQCADVSEKDMLRLRYATETKMANTGIRLQEDRYTHATLVDKIDPGLLEPYTLAASQTSTRGLKTVTKPNGYVGVEGTERYPRTKTEMEAVVLDTLSITSNYIDNIHPTILVSIQE
jgi:hypothetical protein